ncbi:class I SAM-dependent methyltransferase [Xanthomonas oryzae]|uniref:class I SAM-dependent methyltransferase n=2 Tax=Xanthomonas oryzae TaxID=347 RepID=UPI00094A122C|nr:methyltransferase domain-containing protein [Xanthomonas oryzae]AWK20918.1 SAM-dependent methyltransferase [Xanthomonas oryzae pv. oryzae]AXI16537.1 SAM-dependent methyltransferase [Xanthomonas oryzae pv. oryzae]AXI20499.1 SAM-dependent methyltransferase [Xanthomonas oryzae pv. oryzae]AXM12523.1 methyltransferase domain-containing protein [Xanthomonas oryzae pv. oryzae]AXM33652.1 methyltransferase domain-containing protein [Xanthomonas oryzae pv. oryzae]
MSMQFSSPYGSVADSYKARPTYPTELFDWLAGHVSQCVLAWDCGCGSGQGSQDLARYFDGVVATDVSHEQISRASSNSKVEFRATPAHISGLDDASVDLVLLCY